MSNIEKEIYNAQGRNAVILPYPYETLLRLNRLLLLLVLLLMVVIAVLGFYLLPPDNPGSYAEKERGKVDVTKLSMNPVFSDEIDLLKGQMIGLISGSIESKLRTLENSINTGKIGPSSLGAVDDLKNDINILRSLLESSPKSAAAGRSVPAGYAIQDRLAGEISQLKNLMYLTIASCGLMFAAIGGVWIHNQYRLPHDGYIPGEARKISK